VYLGRFHGICDLGVGYFEIVFVAEPPIPQLVYGSVNKLRNAWFRNSWGGVWTYCGTTHSATCIRIRKQVAEYVVPQYVQTFSHELRNHPSATCLRIRIQVAEWVVPRHVSNCFFNLVCFILFVVDRFMARTRGACSQRDHRERDSIYPTSSSYSWEGTSLTILVV